MAVSASGADGVMASVPLGTFVPPIGNVGDSGRTSSANLQFEVRYDNVARDPLYFLPAVEQVAVPGPRPGRGG